MPRNSSINWKASKATIEASYYVPDLNFTASFHNTIDDFSSMQWNALLEKQNPFLRHEFLAALERHDCVGEQFGWYPQHLALQDDSRKLIAACPLYIKTNSYGEFVFDWSWASAYDQVGIPYYPKMVSAIPYNPVSADCLLIHPEHRENAFEVRRMLIEATIQHCEKLELSGMHWLFTSTPEQQDLLAHGLMQRLGCQYHWHNHGYRSFDEFLSRFTSRKRKKVKRERRRVQEQGIEIKTLHGSQISEEQWKLIHSYYETTFERKSGIPTLSLSFFEEIGRTMPESIVINLAIHEQNVVACSICFRSEDTLYGRFWGCQQDYHSLHFETCFYQGIEYCIDHQLQRFEPGAQGEHKIARGFLPTETWSAHWIAHPKFKTVLTDFCQREEQMMHEQCKELIGLSPYHTDH